MMTIVLTIVAALEIIFGIGAILAAKVVFSEIEGFVSVGFGFLTLAVLVGAASIVDAIERDAP